MAKRKGLKQYSYDESLEMLTKLQKMAIDEGNINLALKAEELKCKIAVMQAENQPQADAENLTKILVDFINGGQDSQNSENILPADNGEIPL